MSGNLIWQPNSSSPDNGDRLSAISKWWSDLAGKEIVWQQRLVSVNDSFEDLDWQPQKFDDRLFMHNLEVKGITLYWRNSNTDERNITPSKLCLDSNQQKLYIFPQSQSQVVIRVSLPATVYQKLDLVNPQIAATVKDGKGTILLRDETQKVEVKVALTQAQVKQLLDKLKIADNQ